MVMAVTPGEDVQTPMWDEYRAEMEAVEGDRVHMTEIERFAFYDRAKTAYAVIATGEGALYANLILKKGVIV